jgi:hypothetical protein
LHGDIHGARPIAFTRENRSGFAAAQSCNQAAASGEAAAKTD